MGTRLLLGRRTHFTFKWHYLCYRFHTCFTMDLHGVWVEISSDRFPITVVVKPCMPCTDPRPSSKVPCYSIRYIALALFYSIYSTSFHHISPHLTTPHLTSPHRSSPRLTSSHLTSHHHTAPHLALPQVT